MEPRSTKGSFCAIAPTGNKASFAYLKTTATRQMRQNTKKMITFRFLKKLFNCNPPECNYNLIL